MSLDIRSILDAVRSHAMKTGRFERVEGHELLHPVGHGLAVGVWPDLIRPTTSGLASISVLVVVKVRLYGSVMPRPADEIDQQMVDAANDLMNAYSGNLRLGLAAMRSVDVFGSAGVPLKLQAGYLPVGEGLLQRTIDLDLPLILNDVWEQVA